MNALSGGRSKRYFRISEHHPRWTSNRTFCVAPEPVWLHLGHVYRHFRSKTLVKIYLTHPYGGASMGCDLPSTQTFSYYQPEDPDDSGGQRMEFRLIYQGSLPAEKCGKKGPFGGTEG